MPRPVVPLEKEDAADASVPAQGSDREDQQTTGQEVDQYDLPAGAEATSYIYAKTPSGSRRIYIYLNPGDSFNFEESASAFPPESEEEHSRVTVRVDDKGHRHWKVLLASADTVGTGRLEPPPPPFP